MELGLLAFRLKDVNLAFLLASHFVNSNATGYGDVLSLFSFIQQLLMEDLLKKKKAMIWEPLTNQNSTEVCHHLDNHEPANARQGTGKGKTLTNPSASAP